FWLEDDKMTLESGFPLGEAIRLAMVNNLSGMESLVGIPATIGGAVVMNAGTKYGCIGDIVDRVEMIDEDGRYTTISPHFGYRDSDFKGRKIVITKVYLKLKRSHQDEIREKLISSASLRRTQPQFPRQFGSIFKNPSEGSAGRLIEEAGFKGFRYNGVIISPVHANFLLNLGNSANDIYYVIRLIQEEIYSRFSVFLEPEVNMIGF
ncbi:MAG: UDP-N-acetylmuramate dehydrogenase, partial [bacterium]